MKSAPFVFVFALASGIGSASSAKPSTPGWNLAELPPVARIDPRFQSYNVEMVEVTGGRFWAPYGGPPDEVYRQRPPIDLANPRLRAAARLLAPAYMRVSGTWANTTYVPAAGENLTAPPEGFKQVLQRSQWHGVVAFSRAVDAPIMTSFAVSAGTRDAEGRWRSDQAQRLLDLTREAGGELAAAEFFNEANLPSLAALPAGYKVGDYLADYATFHDWARHSAPGMKLFGPGTIGGAGGGEKAAANERDPLGFESIEAMAAGTRDRIDGFSYHFYGSVSVRCESLGIGTAQKDQALSMPWLDHTLLDQSYYAGLRDRFAPGKPLWLTETAQAACGGSPWAASFLDTFRYLNQLGVLAQKGVQVVMHNTLAASDYALLDSESFAPRPSFWAAVLWRRTMGEVVLAPPQGMPEGVRVFAHCLRGKPGGVALLALNTSDSAASLPLGARANAWTLTTEPLDSRNLLVNGTAPQLDARGRLHGLQAQRIGGALSVPAKAIAFAALPRAGNPACR